MPFFCTRSPRYGDLYWLVTAKLHSHPSLTFLSHSLVQGLEWPLLLQKRYTPPYRPKLSGLCFGSYAGGRHFAVKCSFHHCSWLPLHVPSAKFQISPPQFQRNPSVMYLLLNSFAAQRSNFGLRPPQNLSIKSFHHHMQALMTPHVLMTTPSWPPCPTPFH